ncbi:hypothetical protein CJD36_018700 [Flavipsychrobacter stenotrophus]|uniref:histidine kinase n=1 Tax=Flavipsychrobacter stenotrophus TaxID=2077091 RepID=A0A2S7SQW0_9BACT|nr:ATP-binding protein [Flavipsychrobacter stenotrophus]PQJ09280.1 hypothetical protein CJD36_018700 [Flavipsychrobacter stenotrophus]
MNDNYIITGILLTTLLLLLLVAGIFISIYIAGRQKMEQEIKITQLELGYEKELRQVETEVSEHMMEHFAQELHDNIGHTLTCTRLAIENKKLDEPQLEDTFSAIENYLGEALNQVKLLSRSLNTDYIANIGIIAAIQLEVNRIEQLKKCTIHWQPNDHDVTMDKNRELMTFRIFQEIVNNALKHANARNLFITLNGGNRFELEVKDDGKGFDRDHILATPKASGLKNVLKRAKMAGLECTIESAPGQGCHYKLRETTKIPS